MQPTEVGQSYDSIADRWQDPVNVLGGIEQHERALRFVRNRGFALDAGCGCNGRFMDLLRSNDFTVEGVDVSARMIALARRRDPSITFHHADICVWDFPRQYDFITGGVDVPGDVRDAYMGPPMYTAALGIPQTLAVLAESGCALSSHLHVVETSSVATWILR